MLKNDFFTIHSSIIEEQSGSFSVNINPGHRVFEGHFPSQPVVPGVFTLRMIRECLETVLSKKMQYSELQNCKFSNVIIPDKNQLIQIEYSYETGDVMLLKASVKSGDVIYLSVKAKLIEKES